MTQLDAESARGATVIRTSPALPPNPELASPTARRHSRWIHDPSSRRRRPVDWAARADEAARSVTRLFGQRLFFLPGTHIAAIARPSGRLKNLARPWHYWWQAHYVDCLVDTGRRELGTAGQPPAKFDGERRPSAGQLASRLVTGIRLRNFLTFVNNYYDDMAWLALATLRLEQLAEESRRPGRRRHGRDPEEPDAAVRFGLHGRPGRRHVLEHEAGLQEHPRHGTGGAVLRPHRQPGQGAGPAGLAGRQAVRSRPGPLPGRPADQQQRARRCWRTPSTPTTRARSSAPCWNSAAPPTWRGRRNVVDAVARHLTIPERTQPQRKPAGTGRPPEPPAQRRPPLRRNGRRRPVHRDPGPVPGAGRPRRTAAGSRPGPPPRDWSTDTAEAFWDGRRAASPPANRWRARPAGQPGLLVRARHCRRAAPIRRAPPSNFPPSSRPG